VRALPPPPPVQDKEELVTQQTLLMPPGANSLEAVAAAAARSAEDQGARMLMLVTETGLAPRMVAKYRPGIPIVAVCPSVSRMAMAPPS
jgi:pyruvate kinase